MHSFLLDILLKFIPEVSNSLPSCEQYFSLLCKLVLGSCKGKDGKKPSDFAPLLFQAVDMIQKHPIVEVIYAIAFLSFFYFVSSLKTRDLQVDDSLLRGLMDLCLTIIREEESLKLEIGSMHQ